MWDSAGDPNSNVFIFLLIEKFKDSVLSQIYDWINRTAHDYPDKVKAILVGSSYEKRPLYALKVNLYLC